MKRYLAMVSAGAAAAVLFAPNLASAQMLRNAPPVQGSAQGQASSSASAGQMHPIFQVQGQTKATTSGNQKNGVMIPAGAASSTIRARTEGQQPGKIYNGGMQASGSAGVQGQGNATSVAAHERNAIRINEHFTLRFDSPTTTPAQNGAALQQMIAARQAQLQAQASSSATSTRVMAQHVAQVQLAVHAFLAAREMFGTSSAQVVTLAQEIDRSLASTTQAQAQVQSRGFWAQLFFGGDTGAAKTFTAVAAQNEVRILHLQQLLTQANLSASVQTQLKAQIQALQQAQAQLQLQAKEQNAQWGIFSWRL